jgi:hypothetical protein
MNKLRGNIGGIRAEGNPMANEEGRGDLIGNDAGVGSAMCRGKAGATWPVTAEAR